MSTTTIGNWLWSAGALISAASAVFGQSESPRSLLGHTRGVNDIAFSEGGETLVTASDDRTARIWHLVDASEQAVLRHEGRVRFAAFAPEARVLTISEVSKSDAPKTVRRTSVALQRCRWTVFKLPQDTASPVMLGQGDLGDVTTIEVLPNGGFLVDHRIDPRGNTSRVEIRGLADGEVRSSRERKAGRRSFAGGSREDHRCVVLGATGQWAYVVPGRGGDTIAILDPSGQQRYALPVVNGTIDRLFASREGDLLGAVVVDRDRSRGTERLQIRVWNAITGTPAAQSPLLFGWILGVQFMANGQLGMVVTRSAQARDDPGVVSKFQGVGMLDLASGRLTPVVTDEAPSIGPGGFIQLLHRAAVGANRIAFGLTTKELLGIVSGSDPAGVAWRPYSAEQQRAISRLAFSPNDRYLVAACSPPELSAGHRETFWRDRLLSVWSLTSDGSSPRSTR